MPQNEQHWQGACVSVPALLTHLDRLRSEFADGSRADVRTRVLNLVVFAPDESGHQRAVAAIHRLTGLHPSRSVILQPLGGDGEPSVDAFIAIQRHGSNGASHSVCSELLALGVHGRAVHQLSSLAIPLLVPDLPVFLWWVGSAPFEATVFHDLRAIADRCIVDSSDFEQPADLAAMAYSLRVAGGDCTFSDFNWARLAPWREATAQFFDAPQQRPYLQGVRSITIEASPSGALDLSRALLLAGWLVSALQLEVRQRTIAGTCWAFELGAGDRIVRLEVQTRANASRVCISAANNETGDCNEFSVAATDSQTLTTASTAPWAAPRISFDYDEGAMLMAELKIFAPDLSFGRAVLAVARMLDVNVQQWAAARGSLLV